MSNLTTIAVSPEVKQALGTLGYAGQSYNEVLKRLLKIEEKKSLAGQDSTPDQLATAQSTFEKVTPT